MCGRFALSAPVDTFRNHFNVREAVSLPPRYNIAPGQQVAAVRAGGDGIELAMLPYYQEITSFFHAVYLGSAL